jgi:hypothetical protein
MQALSQLSYSPGKFEIYRKIETGSLTIFGGFNLRSIHRRPATSLLGRR